MNVIEFAEHCLNNAVKQYELGDQLSRSDMLYWAAYLDGARDQKKEDSCD